MANLDDAVDIFYQQVEAGVQKELGETPIGLNIASVGTGIIEDLIADEKTWSARYLRNGALDGLGFAVTCGTVGAFSHGFGFGLGLAWFGFMYGFGKGLVKQRLSRDGVWYETQRVNARMRKAYEAGRRDSIRLVTEQQVEKRHYESKVIQHLSGQPNFLKYTMPGIVLYALTDQPLFLGLSTALWAYAGIREKLHRVRMSSTIRQGVRDASQRYRTLLPTARV